MYVYIYIYIHIHGWKWVDSYWQMLITFRVNTNPFGQLIRNNFGSLQISLSQLQITFANGFAKRQFCPHPVLEKFYAIRSNSANYLRTICESI